MVYFIKDPAVIEHRITSKSALAITVSYLLYSRTAILTEFH